MFWVAIRRGRNRSKGRGQLRLGFWGAVQVRVVPKWAIERVKFDFASDLLQSLICHRFWTMEATPELSSASAFSISQCSQQGLLE
jgi:hypothetical protein